MMKNALRIALTGLGAILWPLLAQAQAPTPVREMCPNASGVYVPCSTAFPLPTTGGVGFTPNGNFATLTVAGSTNSVALPAGTTVAFQNVGTTAVSCTVDTGSATATPNNIVIQPGSTKFAVVGTNDTAACIDQTGSVTNTVVLAGGSGLGTDSGGGGSGGGLTGNLGNNVDNVAPVTTGNIGAIAYSYVFDGTNWQRSQPVNAGACTSSGCVPGSDTLTTLPPLGFPTAMQSAAVANGNGTVLPISTYPIAIVNAVCSVACSGGTTINFEGTDSTGTFFAVQGIPLAGGAGVTTATAGGQWIFNTAGLVSIRARISAYSAGTITVTGNQAFGSVSGGGSGGGAVTQSGVWTVQPGNTANTTAWLMNLGSMGGTAIASGCVSNYGTAPSAVACPSANVFVTNANTNVGNNSDAVAAGATAGSPTVNYNYSFNGTTWDRFRGVTVGGINAVEVAVLDNTGTQLNGYTPGTFAAPSASTISVVTLDPCTSAIKSSVAISVTSATTTSLVATSGTTTVYGCGLVMTIAPSAVTADTALIERGTGAACVTTQTALTGTFGNGDLTTAAPPTVVNYGNGGATIFKSAGTDAICLVTAGTTVNVQGVFTYVQQ